MAHPFREIIRFVGGLEMAAHQERFSGRLGLHPFYGFFSNQIGRESPYPLAEIPVSGPRVGTVYESRVAVLALIIENGIVVKPLRLRFKMPFSDKGRMVSALLKDSGYCRK